MKLLLTLAFALGMVGCVVEQAPAEDDDADAAPSEPAAELETSCVTHGDCPTGTFCHYEAGICGASEGTCTPAAVPRDVMSTCTVAVCGCDGRDYSTACEAWIDGVSVWHEGACNATTEPPEEQPTCGGSVCGAGEFCSYADGACGGEGACTDMIGSCTSAANPVCGCNGITYPSRCSAIQAGISVRHEGGC
jgi:Kazal-type serine protease inhibitor-like protein